MSAPISCTKNVYFCFSPDCLRAKITQTFGEICFISDTQYLTSFTVFSIGVLQMIIMSWKRNKKSSYDYFCSILELEQKIHIIKELDILIWLTIQNPNLTVTIQLCPIFTKYKTFLWACCPLSL